MALPVSCIITSYNNAATLRNAVDSVLYQTAPVGEIVIADDGSTDGSRDLITTLATGDTRITPVLREKNLGVAQNRDLAIRAASLPFVTHLDGDDLFSRGKMAAEWRVLGERADRVAFSDVALVFPRRPWRNLVLSTSGTAGSGNRVLEYLLARRQPIPRDMLLSKTLFEKSGGFSKGMNLYEDWHFKLRLALEDAEWVSSGSIGTIYMQSADGLSKVDEARLLDAQAQVVLSLIDRLEAALGRERLAAVLSDLFGIAVTERAISQKALPKEPRGQKARPLRVSLGNRLRALKYMRDIWPVRNG